MEESLQRRFEEYMSVYGEAVVTFKKKDGSTRVMHCTTDIPDEAAEKLPEHKTPRDGLLQVVYEKGVGWRSFILSSLVLVEGVN